MTWPRSPLILFLLFVLALAVLRPAYFLAVAWRGEQPAILAVELLQRAPGLVLVLWIVADAKERRRTPCFDYGFFLLMLYPFSLFWYWTRTRGWRGLGLATGLFVLQSAPATVSVIVDVIRIASFR
jgi:hypothetical protein